MRFRFFKYSKHCSLLLVAAFIGTYAQTIRISGIAVDGNNQPLSGVVVKLCGKSLLDTTGTDGKFSINRDIVSLKNPSELNNTDFLPNCFIQNNRLNIFNDVIGAKVRISIFDLLGKILTQSIFPLSLSENQIPLSSVYRSSTKNGIYILDIAMLDLKKTYKISYHQNTWSSQPEIGNRNNFTHLSKNLAFVDSILFNKQNYETITRNIDTYQPVLDTIVMRKIPQWTAVGGVGFTEGAVVPKLVSTDDTLYLAYMDKKNGTATTVYKLADTTWNLVGDPGFSYTIHGYEMRFSVCRGKALAVNSRQAGTYFHDLDVRYYLKEAGWQRAVSPPPVNQNYSIREVLVSPSGAFYVAYLNGVTPYIDKYENGAWNHLVTPSSIGRIPKTRCIAAAANLFYLLSETTDWHGEYKLNVLKFENNTWSSVGNPNFGDGNIYSRAICVDNGIPYVFASNNENYSGQQKISVYKLSGSTWFSIAILGFDNVSSPPGEGAKTGDCEYSIDFGVSDSIPFIAYSDRLYAYYSSQWHTIGASIKMPGIATVNNVSLSFIKGLPYIAYDDDWAHYAKLVVVTLK